MTDVSEPARATDAAPSPHAEGREPQHHAGRMFHHLVAGDAAVQSEVLENLSLAVNYREWIVELSRPWLGSSPLEVGSGTGDYAQAWADHGLGITASEADPVRLAELRRRFGHSSAVAVRELAIPIDEDAEYSGVVAINVLEHIEDDVAGLRTFARLSRPGGHVVLFVPAFAFAMSDFDREVGHFRRYRRRGLTETLEAAGLEPVVVHYVNSVGLFGWMVLVKMLKGRPRDGIALRILDKGVIPVLRRLESRLRPPFGQSLFAVARVPSVKDSVSRP
jgi:2-polyprenyl-3-methyl-5-hydroxy-6-metoxy-1,4-benzoquinol methylase